MGHDMMKEKEVSDNRLTARESTAFYCVKAVAILCVITAHTVGISSEPLIRKVISTGEVFFSLIGVPIFFMLGGFFYPEKNRVSKGYWKRKILWLVIPWLFCSTITYISSSVIGPNPPLCSIITWSLGSGTWYYYIVVYLFFIIFFIGIRDFEAVLYALTLVSPIALLLKGAGYQIESTGFLTSFLNPLYWISFFAIGILIRKKRWDRKLLVSTTCIPIAFVVMIICASCLYIFDIITYFHIVSYLLELSAAVLVFRISFWITKFRVADYLKTVGASTFCIYLLHKQIVFAITVVMPEHVMADILSPFVGLGVMMLLITAGRAICRRIPGGQYICRMVGLK